MAKTPNRAKKTGKQKSKDGLSLAVLLKTTKRFRYIYEKAQYVRLYKPAKKVSPLTGTVVITCSAKSRKTKENPKPQIRHCSVKILNGANKVSSSKALLEVSCDCEFFTYYSEVALYRYGAAKIEHSNGEFPYVTNPKGLPILCKHLLAFLDTLRKKGL